MQHNKRNWKYGGTLESYDNAIELNESNDELLPVSKSCPSNASW